MYFVIYIYVFLYNIIREIFLSITIKCFGSNSLTPLWTSTPKLIWIGDKRIIDENVLGVLIPNNDSNLKMHVDFKTYNYTENSHKWKLVQQWTNVHMAIEYNCSQRFVISIVIKLGKTLN